jgi:hypothetical protein
MDLRSRGLRRAGPRNTFAVSALCNWCRAGRGPALNVTCPAGPQSLGVLAKLEAVLAQGTNDDLNEPAPLLADPLSMPTDDRSAWMARPRIARELLRRGARVGRNGPSPFLSVARLIDVNRLPQRSRCPPRSTDACADLSASIHPSMIGVRSRRHA